MDSNPSAPLEELARHAMEVAVGDFESAKKIHELTKPGRNSKEFRAVAEAFGMMAVKVEAREFGLEQALKQIQKKNAALQEAARVRSEFGMTAIFIVITLCLYSIALALVQNLPQLTPETRKWTIEAISFAFLLLQLGMVVIFISTHKPAPASYGWTLHHWKRSVAESLALSILAFIWMLGVKWMLLFYFPASEQKALVDWGYWGGWVTVTSYLFVAPMQELIARGFLQTSIENFLTGRHRESIAILLTAAQFGVVHLHFSFKAGILATISGLYFGVIFARQRSLLGPALCHYIVGTLAFGPLRLLDK